MPAIAIRRRDLIMERCSWQAAMQAAVGKQALSCSCCPQVPHVALAPLVKAVSARTAYAATRRVAPVLVTRARLPQALRPQAFVRCLRVLFAMTAMPVPNPIPARRARAPERAL